METDEDIDVEIPVYAERITELKVLKPGDQLAVKGEAEGITYFHHGIFIGFEEGVVNFGGEDKKSATIQTVDILKFNDNCRRTLVRIKYDERNCLPVEMVIKRATTMAENPDNWETFDLFTNNCEHFATWCKTGIRHSKQVVRKIVEFMKDMETTERVIGCAVAGSLSIAEFTD